MLREVKGTLMNGLRVVVIELPHLHSVACSFTARSGPRHESPETNGLSHLVEHMVFRGTRSRPSSFLLNSAIESIGGEINGLTQRDATTIHLTVPPSSVNEGVALLADLCTRPKMEGLEVEKQIVIEEILDTLDGEGRENDIDTLSRAVLWRNHPLALPVAGTVKNVERFTLRQCRAHFSRTFAGANGVFCVAGPVKGEEVLALVERTFSKMPRGQRLVGDPPPVVQTQVPIQIRETDDAQATILLTFPAPHERDPEFAALLLLRRLLDDGLSSRLRQAVCEQRGLAYSVAATVDAYEDAAAIDLEATSSPKKLVVTVAQLLSTLKQLTEVHVEDSELERAKTRHKAEFLFGLDDPQALCSWTSSSHLMGLAETYEDRIAQVQDVRSPDILRLARRIFDPARALLTMVGPVHANAASKLERLVGRAAGSSVWLNQASTPDNEKEHEVDGAQMRQLSEWAQNMVASDNKSQEPQDDVGGLRVAS